MNSNVTFMKYNFKMFVKNHISFPRIRIEHFDKVILN